MKNSKIDINLNVEHYLGFTVTKKWLEDNQTPNGSYNAYQLRAIGLDFETKDRGWKKRLIGKEIELSQKKAFEEGRFKNKPKNKRSKITNKTSSAVIDEFDRMFECGNEIVVKLNYEQSEKLRIRTKQQGFNTQEETLLYWLNRSNVFI